MESHRLSPLGKACVYALLLLCAAGFALPFLWMLSTALKPLEETLRLPPVWIPSEPRWENFPEAIEAMGDFWRYAANTLYLCLLTVAGTVLSSSLAAYGFARIEWRGRDALFTLCVATMLIPLPVIMTPVYTLFRELGWIGSFKPLWTPAFLGHAFSIFLLRQFFLGIPRDVVEAARIDGCSELRILFQIVLPMARSALLVVALFAFMNAWNDFLGPLIYLTDERDFTLALGLQAFQSRQAGADWHYLMAASTLVALPLIFLFLFVQRRFIQGIAATGGK